MRHMGLIWRLQLVILFAIIVSACVLSDRSIYLQVENSDYLEQDICYDLGGLGSLALRC